MDHGSPAPSSRRITSSRDRAKIRYIPPDLDVDALIAETSNFEPVPRLDATQYTTEESMKELEAIIERHVVKEGTPLVITNWHKRSDWPWLNFSTQWLHENHGKDHISIRDLIEGTDIKMSLGHYLRNLPILESKFTAHDYESGQQRLYAKDIDCPPTWRDKLQEILPSSTFYLSECDLMASLPKNARAENMMCYFGHEGTYTPAHKDMCASLGQNIMVCATGRVDEEPGSSIWFMAKSSDRHDISEYWLSRMGHDIEVEKHFASIEDLQDAPFPIYIHEQKVGDYILVPSVAPHQVWNRGQATLKAAWNRITVDTLELALSEALPKVRLVCRDESYRTRAIVYDTLKQYYNVLRGASTSTLDSSKVRSDFVRLFKLFDRIMLDECFDANKQIPKVERIENEYNVTCSFCRGNIWNKFLTCKGCTIHYEDGEDDCYDVCMDCYARGRSCACISKLSWVEQFSWKVLSNNHEYFRRMAISIQGGSAEKTVLPLAKGSEQLGRKSLARVCQEQLKIRPWRDVTIAPNDANGPKQRITDEAQPNCHVCKVRHESWRCAECSTCGLSYCYGNLWRAFDLDPFDDILSKARWECPKCLNICSCGNCRKKGKTVPYQPKGTALGFSTKHVADPRSTESLVDFARGNLGWIKQTGAPVGEKRKRNSMNDTESNSIGPALSGGTPSSFIETVTNPNNNAGVEGRSLPAALEHREVASSNIFASVQTQLHLAQQVRAQGEANAVGVAGVGVPGVSAQNHRAPPEKMSNNDMLQTLAQAALTGHAPVAPMMASNAHMEYWDNQIINQNHHSHFHPNKIARHDSPHSPFSSPPFNQPHMHQSHIHQPHTHQQYMYHPPARQSPTTLEQDPFTFMLNNTPPPPPPPVSANPHDLFKTPLPSAFISPTTPETPPRRPLPRRPRRNDDIEASLSSLFIPNRVDHVGDALAYARGSGRNKSLLVTLQVPRERFREILVQLSKVTSDLICTAPGVFVIASEYYANLENERGMKDLKEKSKLPARERNPNLVKRGRGRPRTDSKTPSRKNEKKSPLFKQWDRDYLDNTNDEDEFPSSYLAASVDRAAVSQRRKEAYIRRKKEEDKAKVDFLSAVTPSKGNKDVMKMIKTRYTDSMFEKDEDLNNDVEGEADREYVPDAPEGKDATNTRPRGVNSEQIPVEEDRMDIDAPQVAQPDLEYDRHEELYQPLQAQDSDSEYAPSAPLPSIPPPRPPRSLSISSPAENVPIPRQLSESILHQISPMDFSFLDKSLYPESNADEDQRLIPFSKDFAIIIKHPSNQNWQKEYDAFDANGNAITPGKLTKPDVPPVVPNDSVIQQPLPSLVHPQFDTSMQPPRPSPAPMSLLEQLRPKIPAKLVQQPHASAAPIAVVAPMSQAQPPIGLWGPANNPTTMWKPPPVSTFVVSTPPALLQQTKQTNQAAMWGALNKTSPVAPVATPKPHAGGLWTPKNAFSVNGPAPPSTGLWTPSQNPASTTSSAPPTFSQPQGISWRPSAPVAAMWRPCGPAQPSSAIPAPTFTSALSQAPQHQKCLWGAAPSPGMWTPSVPAATGTPVVKDQFSRPRGRGRPSASFSSTPATTSATVIPIATPSSHRQTSTPSSTPRANGRKTTISNTAASKAIPIKVDRKVNATTSGPEVTKRSPGSRKVTTEPSTKTVPRKIGATAITSASAPAKSGLAARKSAEVPLDSTKGGPASRKANATEVPTKGRPAHREVGPAAFRGSDRQRLVAAIAASKATKYRMTAVEITGLAAGPQVAQGAQGVRGEGERSQVSQGSIGACGLNFEEYVQVEEGKNPWE